MIDGESIEKNKKQSTGSLASKKKENQITAKKQEENTNFLKKYLSLKQKSLCENNLIVF